LEIPGQYLKIGHDYFLPHPSVSSFPVTLPHLMWHYKTSEVDTVL